MKLNLAGEYYILIYCLLFEFLYFVEYDFLKKLAKENEESIGETIAVIIRAYKETTKL